MCALGSFNRLVLPIQIEVGHGVDDHGQRVDCEESDNVDRDVVGANGGSGQADGQEVLGEVVEKTARESNGLEKCATGNGDVFQIGIPTI